MSRPQGGTLVEGSEKSALSRSAGTQVRPTFGASRKWWAIKRGSFSTYLVS